MKIRPAIEGFNLGKEEESMWYTSIDMVHGYCHTFDVNLNPKVKVISMKEVLNPVISFENINDEELTKILVHDHLDMAGASIFYYAQTLPNIKGMLFEISAFLKLLKHQIY